MKRNFFINLMTTIFKWSTVFKENRRLKTNMQRMVKHRNELLCIIVTNSQITEISGQGEPLFIATKSLHHSIVFNIYNYDPEKLAAGKLSIAATEATAARIEIPEHTPMHLRNILQDHIEKESKRLGMSLAAG